MVYKFIIGLLASLGGLFVVLYGFFWMLTSLFTWNKFENYLAQELILHDPAALQDQ